ncbi:unnamed protein product [Cuscuta campestris]|uniref:Uncharacterized protein n=1 Tax=Cuscuta campestris TaxID=132261 RepID=A0A484M2D3_9ASTE|nr:unnamed protein product [Cuscuta campestris]
MSSHLCLSLMHISKSSLPQLFHQSTVKATSPKPLDLVSRKWSKPLVRGVPPAARFDHAATVHTARRELLIFGGIKYLEFVNDLHVLNIDTWEWLRPKQHGDIPGPRRGHAGATIGDSWFIFGGYNGTTADDLIVLIMSNYVWSVLPTTGECMSATTMGSSLVASNYEGQTVLISFGGFSNCLANKVHILKPSHKSPLMTPIPNRTYGVHSAPNDTFDPRGTGKTESTDASAAEDHLYELQYLRDQLRVEELKYQKLKECIGHLNLKLFACGHGDKINLSSGS